MSTLGDMTRLLRFPGVLLVAATLCAATVAVAQDMPAAAPSPAPSPVARPAEHDDLEPNPADPEFTLINLPTTARLPRHKSAFRVTHRFARPLGQGDFGDLAADAFAFDGGAQIALMNAVRFFPSSSPTTEPMTIAPSCCTVFVVTFNPACLRLSS